jgi:hypothetical protein
MRNLGKSKKESDEDTRDRNGDVSEESEDYDLNRGEKRKPKSSRFRSRSTKRARAQGMPSGVTPKSKEPRIEVPESRFGAKFDWDAYGVMIKPSKEREEAIRRVRDDKEKRYIADARPHRPSGGERGGGGDLDSDDWQQQRGRGNRDGGRGSGRGRGRNSDRSANNDKYGKNFTSKLINNSGATLGTACSGTKF